MIRRIFILCAVVATFAPLLLHATSETMDQEIDYLLSTVAESDCVFIRNGKEYEGEAARKHLQMKRERGRKYYESTDEFIERIASKSSWSGKPYRIRCGDVEEDAGIWFTDVLTLYRDTPD